MSVEARNYVMLGIPLDKVTYEDRDDLEVGCLYLISDYNSEKFTVLGKCFDEVFDYDDSEGYVSMTEMTTLYEKHFDEVNALFEKLPMEYDPSDIDVFVVSCYG